MAIVMPMCWCMPLMDALLGALSLGDIGKYFPPTDPKWKGADSLMLLEQVVQLVGESGLAGGESGCCCDCGAAQAQAPH